MLILEECFKLRENGSFLDSKLRLWKWLRDQTDSGQTYYALGRAASIIGILFRLTKKSNESFTSNFRISEKIATVCTTKPQQHKSNRVKNHTIFPISDTDILQEHVLDDNKCKFSSVIKHLLKRTNHLLTSSRCGHVISDIVPLNQNLY